MKIEYKIIFVLILILNFMSAYATGMSYARDGITLNTPVFIFIWGFSIYQLMCVVANK